MKALIVEPSSVYQLLLRELLSGVSISASFVESGNEAKKRIDEEEYDFVVVAMHLADMTGIEFSQLVRANDNPIHIPIIMLTSECDDNLIEKCCAAGIHEVYQKSSIKELKNTFRILAGKSYIVSRVSGRIAYVEDQISLANMTIEILESMGVTVDHFCLGEELYAHLQNNEYDLLLVDIMLPGEMDGYGLVSSVRKLGDPLGRIPILALSVKSDDLQRINILRCGANDFVAKPVVQAELAARVKNLITNKLLLDKMDRHTALLEQLVMVDPLTSLYNRHYLNEVSRKQISESIRHCYPFSMIMVDLDYFKDINDKYGHDVGDQVLVSVAAVLQTFCRNEDTVARYGGEEFLLLFPHCDMKQAKERAAVLCHLIEDLRPLGIQVTASFGVSSIRKGSTDFDSLFKEADKAVYRAKTNGRNCVAFEPFDAVPICP